MIGCNSAVRDCFNPHDPHESEAESQSDFSSTTLHEPGESGIRKADFNLHLPVFRSAAYHLAMFVQPCYRRAVGKGQA